LVWLLTRHWSKAQEAACDELLIQSNLADPAEYGRLLLKLSTYRPLKPCSALVAAGMFGSYRNLERRILTMNRVRPYSYRRLVIAAGVLSLLATPSIVPWRLVAQEPKATTQLNLGSALGTSAPRADKEPARGGSGFRFTGTLSADGKTGTIYTWVAAERLPGRIYAWAALELKPRHGVTENYRGVIAIDPNTGEWEKLGSLGHSVRVSPQQDRLLWTNNQGGFTTGRSELTGVFAADRAGQSRLQIAENGFNPIWSSDEKSVICNVSNAPKAADRRGSTAWLYDFATKKLQKLAIPETDEVDDWSQDGNWVVTTSDRHPPFGHGYQLYVMHTDGTGERRLTTDGGLNCYPRFRPATNQVVYNHQWRGVNSLWIVDIDGSNRKQLLTSDNNGNGAPNGASWSPDGKWLAVSRFDWKIEVPGIANPNKEKMRVPGYGNDRIEIIAADGAPRIILKLDDVTKVLFLSQPDWR